MGSTGSSQNWKPPSNLYTVLDYKYCKVWVHKQTKSQDYQEYPVQITNQKQLEQYQNIFALRLQQQHYPRTFYFFNKNPSFLCSTQKQGSILIQRIPYRLCQFIKIPYQQMLSMLYICLKGYQILYKFIGLFRVKTTMIGLDCRYKIKMWYHTELTNTYPEDPFCYTVYEMVVSIVRCMENIAEQPTLLRKRFVQFVADQNLQLFSFELAIKMVEDYARFYGIKLKNKFQYIQKYLKQAEGIQYIFNTINTSKIDIRESQKHEFTSTTKRKNKSLGKFSFRSNKIINQQEDDSILKVNNQTAHTPSQISNSIYYNNLTVKQQSKQKQLACLQRRKATLSKLITTSTPYQDNRMQFYSPSPRYIDTRQTTTKPDSNKPSLTSLQDYGLNQIYNQYHKPIINKNQVYGHGRAASKYEQLARQSTNDSKSIYMHVRAASDLPFKNNSNNTNYNNNKNQHKNIIQYSKPASPYFQNSETKSGQGSTKSMKSANSYSFIVDQQIRNDVANMLKNKNL